MGGLKESMRGCVCYKEWYDRIDNETDILPVICIFSLFYVKVDEKAVKPVKTKAQNLVDKVLTIPRF